MDWYLRVNEPFTAEAREKFENDSYFDLKYNKYIIRFTERCMTVRSRLAPLLTFVKCTVRGKNLKQNFAQKLVAENRFPILKAFYTTCARKRVLR